MTTLSFGLVKKALGRQRLGHPNIFRFPMPRLIKVFEKVALSDKQNFNF